MCYSAQVKEQWRTYLHYGGRLGLKEFVELYKIRMTSKVSIPKAWDAWFANPASAEEAEVKALIDQYNREKSTTWEQELFKQRKRLVDAQRALESKVTKKAQEDVRIASSKIEQLKDWLETLHRTEPQSRDSRIYPGHYAPVMILQDGERVIVPMRYHCRPADKPAFFDSKYPGTYNARRDNLEGYWKGTFGQTHGVMIATAFYENVEQDGRNVVLKFKPGTSQDMLVACLWARWTGKEAGDELYSFAAITDEPPAEVAAAGHDRCIIPLREANLDAWLKPQGNLQRAYEILDDRERPYYEHRLAA